MITLILLVAIYVLNLIDYGQTVYAIHLAGLQVEANPIGRFLFENNYEWVAKFIVLPLLLIALGLIIKTDKRFIWGAWWLLIHFTIVVIHNFIVLIQMNTF